MRHRFGAFLIAIVSLSACTDHPTGPDAQAPVLPLPLPQYALQLLGDPFLGNIADLLGRPELKKKIDDAVIAVGREEPNAGSFSFAPVQMSVSLTADQDVGTPISEADVLTAVVEITLDRLAQVADSAAPNPQPPQ